MKASKDWRRVENALLVSRMLEKGTWERLCKFDTTSDVNYNTDRRRSGNSRHRYIEVHFFSSRNSYQRSDNSTTSQPFPASIPCGKTTIFPSNLYVQSDIGNVCS